jgi:DNA polymerase-4
MSRAIVHLDGDAFFAAVEQAADPRLRGKPVAVGGERRGVITSASYEARKFGIKAAMPSVQARKLCPRLIIIPGDFERYEQFSRIMFSYAEDHTPLVEVQGLDEGYYDLTPNRAKPPAEIAAVVQKAIWQSLKITVSEGLATNKLVSQIASKAYKPAGFRVVPPGDEAAFLHPLPNRWLPGVGPKLASRLNAAGLAEIRHIAAMPADLLELVAGSQARQLLLFAQGIDERPVVQERATQKSYSNQETFGADLTDEDYAEAVLRRMADDLFTKVRGDRAAVRTLTVTVKFNDHEQARSSESLVEPTNIESDVYGRLRGLMKRAWNRRVSLRMVGLRLSNVYDGRFAGELELPGEGASHERRERAILAVEDLRHRFGQEIILRGHDFVLRDGPRDATVSASKPTTTPAVRIGIRVNAPKRIGYIPLGCPSHYSFLDSTLSPEQIVELAKRHEIPAIALTDLGNLHGAGEFAAAAKVAGIKPVFGAELSTQGGALFVYVRNRAGYANLCRLLSRTGTLPAPEVEDAAVATRQRLPFSRAKLAEHAEGLIAVSTDESLASTFGSHFFRAVTKPELADHPRGILVPRTHYGTREERRHFEIVQSIRTRTLLQQPHPEKRTGDFPFRAPDALPKWVHEHPALLRRTQEVADACEFTFPFGPPQFPDFLPPDGTTPRAFLARLVNEGLRRRYGARADGLRAQIEEELSIIAAVGYEALFLHTWSLLQDCRAAGIEWITRGSAADSLVCYSLGISNVCPIRFELYFKRFLNPERMAATQAAGHRHRHRHRLPARPEGRRGEPPVRPIRHGPLRGRGRVLDLSGADSSATRQGTVYRTTGLRASGRTARGRTRSSRACGRV